MDDVRLGTKVRALRHRLGWRQQDLATRAGVTQDDISRIERGRIGAMPFRKVRHVAAALEVDISIVVRFRGGDLDRLMDEGHATLVGRVAAMLRAAAWQVRIEVSYAIYGERGSIDILAWHAGTRMLLVVEVKTDLVVVEETLRKHDEKARLAARIAREQFGWNAVGSARLLILPSVSTQRRRVQRHASVLDVAYPLRGAAVGRWIRAPAGIQAALLFINVEPTERTGHSGLSRRRVRTRAA